MESPASKLIPCLDLKSQLEQVKSEIFQAFNEVYDEAAFSGGAFVENFEKLFAQYIGANHVVGVNSGTSALQLALIVAGIKPGDEVILPSSTFIATAWAVSYVGATPVFADCDKNTWQINTDSIKKCMTPKTRAVIGVHLYGQAFNVDEVSAFCKSNNLLLIEDAAQAQGSKYKSKMIGAGSDLACFSFYPGKNLGACGEGGAIVTNNKEFYQHLIRLRNHGSDRRYYHDEIGYNMRMGGLEAASLSVKLKYLDSWNDRRRVIANQYQSKIKNSKITLQEQPSWADSNYHLFVVTIEKRDEFVSFLEKNGIAAAYHYPVPCHLQKAYSKLGYTKGILLNSEYLADHCVSLPMFAELNDEQVSHIIDVLNRY